MNVLEKLLDFKTKYSTGLLNLTGGFFALYINYLLKKEDRSILIVTPTIYEANQIYQNISNYNDCLLFENDDFITSEAIAMSPELKNERLNLLKQLVKNNKKIIVTDVNGYLKYLPTKELLKNKIIKLKINSEQDPKELVNKLYNIGYTRETIVSKTGEMGIRGFVLDVFPFDSDNPIRIEFFGNTIDSIRYFDIETQKSIEEIEKIEIFPYSEFLTEEDIEIEDKKQKDLGNYTKVVNILDYLPDPIVIFKDYNQIEISYDKLLNEIYSYREQTEEIDKVMFELDEIKYKDYLVYLDFDSNSNLQINDYHDFRSFEIEKLNEDIDKINKYLKSNIAQGKTIIIYLQKTNIKKFYEALTTSYILTTEDQIIENSVNIIAKDMNRGFGVKNYIFLTEYELFNRKNEVKRKKTNFKFTTRIKDISKIEIGDYVVHNTHGIGIYNGIKTLEKNGFKNDYLEVLYAKSDKLYIPASKIELLSKYSGKEGYQPKINALNSVAWYKTKQLVKEKIKYEAERLLKVQAERELKKGFAFSKDTEEQELFENEFIYEMTPDQLTATEQIKKDMESIAPMDRILCGDVGYGKTEVAFRAIFKAVMDSKQVLYLCPTTLLSKQQYESAIERFRNFPINIGILNRFTSAKQTKKILEDLKNGTIDIVFGTHRILSNDVKPKDLGLLIVDEEQRFGVAHKEKIKEYKSNIDVLTLTATPIPRTLQMAMLGLKNLSLIETPPKNRYSIQTYVTEENKKIIKDIIYKELSREGQVFILYNKVGDIESRTREIEMLAPDARVTFAHGQMPKSELENKMNDFINKEYDVLVCTTIIETGIDIPNANSLIIYDADKFGLSQLYQIRGRIGRSDRIAYAYLMYNRGKILTETAIKRLKVIKEFTELGSGFKIATRDLSIRGAGDILGAEQAGFIDFVGIDLYLKMLNDEIARLKGQEVEEEVETENINIKISNHIKDNYVTEEDLKIEIHKLINEIDSFTKFEQIKIEIQDRFGKIDKDMFIYMNEELFENLTKNLGINQITENNNYMEIVLDKNLSEKINYQNLFLESLEITNEFKFTYKNNRLYIKLNKNKLKDHPLIYFNKLLEKM